MSGMPCRGCCSTPVPVRTVPGSACLRSCLTGHSKATLKTHPGSSGRAAVERSAAQQLGSPYSREHRVGTQDNARSSIRRRPSGCAGRSQCSRCHSSPRLRFRRGAARVNRAPARPRQRTARPRLAACAATAASPVVARGDAGPAAPPASGGGRGYDGLPCSRKGLITFTPS